MKIRPTAKKDNLVIQKTENELLVYDLNSNRALCLNETSVLVWKFCDGQMSVSEIAANVSKSLNKTVSEELVWLALDQLEKEGLLEGRQGIESPFEGVSRREVIRKVGMASMVALPIISSIAAPTSAQAQSCSGTINVAGGGGSCQANPAACAAFACRCIPGNGAMLIPNPPACGPAPAGACICNP